MRTGAPICSTSAPGAPVCSTSAPGQSLLLCDHLALRALVSAGAAMLTQHRCQFTGLMPRMSLADASQWTAGTQNGPDLLLFVSYWFWTGYPPQACQARPWAAPTHGPGRGGSKVSSVRHHLRAARASQRVRDHSPDGAAGPPSAMTCMKDYIICVAYPGTIDQESCPVPHIGCNLFYTHSFS